MTKVCVLKGNGPVREEVGSIMFKRLPAEAEEDIVRRGIDIAFSDIQRIGERLCGNEVIGHVGIYEWRVDD